jgi:hypothetical protein
MATKKKILPQHTQAIAIITAMGSLLAVYGLLLLLWALNATGSLSATFGALRLGLLFAVIAMGGTYLYLRFSQKKGPARAPSATAANGYSALKKEVEAWMTQLAEALKSKAAFEDIGLPTGVEDLKNHTKLNAAWRTVLAEMESLQSDKQRAAALTAQKEKQIKALEEAITGKDTEIAGLKTAAEASLRQISQQKQDLSKAQQEYKALAAEAEKQKGEAALKIDRYRNISKFLEAAKSALYRQHGTGNEYLVQLKLGLLADDVINLSNKNDYFSMNYELFRNGRPFEQLVKEQPPVHIDAYPDSVKKLRSWIKSNGLENENWDLFYQNYPVSDKIVR